MGAVLPVGPLIALLWACATECDADCRFERAKLTLSTDKAATLAELRAVADPVERDMVAMRLAQVDPTQAGYLCAEVTTAYGLTRCEQVVGRPHLGATPAP